MKKIIISFAALIVFVACEKEIPLKQDEIAPRIVVNSIFSENDTVWVHISESRNILYEEQLPVISNATAQLLDASDNVIGTFIYDTDGRYYCIESLPTVGNTYGLRIEAPGMTTVTASSETPSIISLTSIDTAAAPGSQLEFNLSFLDDASQDNFYGVSVVYHGIFLDDMGEEIIYQSPYFSTKEFYVINGEEDIDGQKYAMEFFFSDNGINGQTINFSGLKYRDDWSELGSYYVVGLKSLSEDLYKYKLSYSKYLNTQGSPFAEPVQVYSNIEDGFGIFGGSSSYRDTIWVD